MSSSGQRTHLKLVELVTVGDFDPQTDAAIEYDFIGRVIAGRYTVRAHIGGGGMADVFRATDEQLGVDVAIKLLKPRLASDELRARMVQEARAAAQVRHANLVRVFATGELDGTAYIVMELLDGPNLEEYLREYRDQRMPWRAAVELLLPALAALHAVHERGYVHRDIKTGNILVARGSGGPPSAVVIDLGLVKPDRALRTAASPPTTEVGRMLCTPGYTSPEQAAGRPVDRRSDVYSMAVTLYRVLAGRLPFHEARGQPVMVVLARHIYNAPTLLAEAAVGADIPPAIAAVIEGALRKRPADRPATMLAFAEALQAAALETDARASRRPHALLLAFGLGAAVAALATLRPGADGVVAVAADEARRGDGASVSEPRSVEGATSVSEPRSVEGASVSDLRRVEGATSVSEPRRVEGATSVSEPRRVEGASVSELRRVEGATSVSEPRRVGGATGVSEPRSVDGATPESAGANGATHGPTHAAADASTAGMPASAAPADGPIEHAPQNMSKETPDRSAPDRELRALWGRALARRAAAVQGCADQATGSRERLVVRVAVDPAGRVRASVVDAPESPLSRCVDVELGRVVLPAPRATTHFIRVFKLRATPRRG